MAKKAAKKAAKKSVKGATKKAVRGVARKAVKGPKRAAPRKAVTKKPAARKPKAENTLFPGRPNYVGPNSGYFAMLHHSNLWEYSHNVAERVDYVKFNKPRREIAVRLRNMIYIGADRPGSDAAVKRYVLKHMPNTNWDWQRRQLRYANGKFLYQL